MELASLVELHVVDLRRAVVATIDDAHGPRDLALAQVGACDRLVPGAAVRGEPVASGGSLSRGTRLLTLMARAS